MSIESYLEERRPTCPLCGDVEWTTPPDGPHALETAPSATNEWVLPVGVYLLICCGCGFIAPIHDMAVEQDVNTTEDADGRNAV